MTGTVAALEAALSLGGVRDEVCHARFGGVSGCEEVLLLTTDCWVPFEGIGTLVVVDGADVLGTLAIAVEGEELEVVVVRRGEGGIVGVCVLDGDDVKAVLVLDGVEGAAFCVFMAEEGEAKFTAFEALDAVLDDVCLAGLVIFAGATSLGKRDSSCCFVHCFRKSSSAKSKAALRC
jgi:hypothetical protein